MHGTVVCGREQGIRREHGLLGGTIYIVGPRKPVSSLEEARLQYRGCSPISSLEEARLRDQRSSPNGIFG